VLVEKQRGVSTTGSSITLSMNSITNDTEVRVEYVLNSDGTTVVASVPGAGTLLKIVQDVGTSELLARIVVLESQVATLQTNLAAVQANSALSLGAYVEVDPDALNGLAGPHVIFNGANVSIQSGSGATDDNFTPSGLGNLIIGYNEDDDGNTTRTGSHNLVIGPEHTYTSFGGFVAGLGNTISGGHASVSGGSDNTADGYSASVSGGSGRTALGDYDWVAGDLL